MDFLLRIVAFVVLAPLAGGLVVGVDRVVTARMQGRVGPPLLQPFYDVLKLVLKKNLVVNRFHSHYLLGYLVFSIFSGALFFAGEDLLMVIFAFTLGHVFLILAACSTHSPYSFIGAQRELLQLMAAEPMLLLTAVGLFTVTDSFAVSTIAVARAPLFLSLPGVFIGFLFILTIKFRKSPFDLSTSHHAHQELVKGLTTEFAGPSLAMVEIGHWYETILLLGFIYLFFGSHPPLAVGVALIAYFIEIVIDNTYARFRWQMTLGSAWITTLILGGGNLIILHWLGAR